jgi:hypothetical protein
MRFFGCTADIATRAWPPRHFSIHALSDVAVPVNFRNVRYSVAMGGKARPRRANLDDVVGFRPAIGSGGRAAAGQA